MVTNRWIKRLSHLQNNLRKSIFFWLLGKPFFLYIPLIIFVTYTIYMYVYVKGKVYINNNQIPKVDDAPRTMVWYELAPTQQQIIDQV